MPRINSAWNFSIPIHIFLRPKNWETVTGDTSQSPSPKTQRKIGWSERENRPGEKDPPQSPSICIRVPKSQHRFSGSRGTADQILNFPMEHIPKPLLSENPQFLIPGTGSTEPTILSSPIKITSLQLPLLISPPKTPSEKIF